MIIPSSEIRIFLNQLFQGHIAESERILASLKAKYPAEARYFQALEGILHSYVNDDHDSLIFTIYRRRELWRRRADIGKYIEKLAKRADTVDSYFSAWVEVIRLLDRVAKPHKLAQKVEEDNP